MKRIRAVILAVLMAVAVAVSAVNVGAEEATDIQSPDNVFVNELKRGSLEVTKTAEDGFVEDISFHLYGTSDSGEKIDMRSSTDSSGKVRFENIPIGTYTLSEDNVPARYIIPADVTVKVTYDEITQVTFENVLKPPPPESPQTGQTSFLVPLLTVMVISVGIIIFFVVLKKKKK